MHLTQGVMHLRASTGYTQGLQQDMSLGLGLNDVDISRQYNSSKTKLNMYTEIAPFYTVLVCELCCD